MVKKYLRKYLFEQVQVLVQKERSLVHLRKVLFTDSV